MPPTSVDSAYRSLAEAFASRNPRSEEVYEQATKHLPGGNTRSVLYYHPFPLSTNSASGSRLVDVDGHEYVDLLGEYTAGLYGHSEPAIINAITEAAKRGLNFGSQHAVSSHANMSIFDSIDASVGRGKACRAGQAAFPEHGSAQIYK